MLSYRLDTRDLSLFMRVKECDFTGRVPASTGVGVTSLAMPGLLVETTCTARLGDGA